MVYLCSASCKYLYGPSRMFPLFLLGSASCQAIETEWEFLFNLRGLFLQSVGFPFDSQGPGFSRNFLILLSHYKAIENGNQTCSLGLVGRMTCLALNIQSIDIIVRHFRKLHRLQCIFTLTIRIILPLLVDIFL